MNITFLNEHFVTLIPPDLGEKYNAQFTGFKFRLNLPEY